MEKINNIVDFVKRHVRVDGWYNAMTGLGTSERDKNMSMNFSSTVDFTDEDLASLYDEDDLAKKIVNSAPEEAFRQKITVETSNGDMDADAQSVARDAIIAQLDNLNAHEVIYEAVTWGRLFGGGIVVIGADDGSAMDMPLVEERVSNITFLNVLDKRDLNPVLTQHGLYVGSPEIYSVTTSAEDNVENGMHIHASRLLIFGGALTSRRKKRDRSSWDLSVLESVKKVMAYFSSDWQSVSNMLSDASQGVLKIKGFYEMLAQGLGQDFQTRLDVMDLAKFVGRILPIDNDEDYQYVARSFAGMPDLLDRSMYRISAATQPMIPVTKLFGRSPAGQNATGESDLTNWFCGVESEQTRKYGPKYNKLVRIIAHSLGIPEPASWHVVWPSLWSESPQKAAATRKTQAETDQIYISTGVVDPDEIAPVRFAGGEYTTTAPSPDMELRESFKDDLRSTDPTDEDNSPKDDKPQPDDAREDAREDASERWQKMVPTVILDDLEAIEHMVKGGMPNHAVRPVVLRLAQNLGIATQEVIDEISTDDYTYYHDYGQEHELCRPVAHHRSDASDVRIPPMVISYIMAFNTLRRVMAGHTILETLAHRIVDGLGIGTEELHGIISNKAPWYDVVDKINDAPRPAKPVQVTINIETSQ